MKLKQGRKQTIETKKKIKKNHTRYWLGKKRSKETREKISRSISGKTYEEMMGKKKAFEKREKMRKTMKGRQPCNSIGWKGRNHPNWKGGKSFECYGLEFNNELREQIRKRDNFTCQECSKIQKELKYKLSVHHIDYNKKNNNPNNLITLCKKCHSKTNYKREDWSKYFKQKL